MNLLLPRALRSVLLLGFCSVIAASAAETKPADFSAFDLSPGNAFWRVEHGVLIGANDESKKGSMLWTKESYGDFALEFDVRWEGPIDSGVIFRKPQLQMQIGTSISLKRELTGSFYVAEGKDHYPEVAQAKEIQRLLKPGQWNRIRLEARGNEFTVWINGEKASHYRNALYAAPAPIGLQIHQNLHMKVEFRDLKLTAL